MSPVNVIMLTFSTAWAFDPISDVTKIGLKMK